MWFVPKKLANSQFTRPRPGDTLITLKVNADGGLEERAALLFHGFVKCLQGATLRVVMNFDIIAGEATFVMCDDTMKPRATGDVYLTVEDWEGSITVVKEAVATEEG